MTAFITYSMMIVMSFLMLTMMSIMLPRAAVAADRIDEVIQTESSIHDAKEPEKVTTHNGVVKFSHVNFKYPGAEEDVLHDIDLQRNRDRPPQSLEVPVVVNPHWSI